MPEDPQSALRIDAMRLFLRYFSMMTFYFMAEALGDVNAFHLATYPFLSPSPRTIELRYGPLQVPFCLEPAFCDMRRLMPLFCSASRYFIPCRGLLSYLLLHTQYR